MADDELEQEQEQELVVPEADERSRWIARHPVGCAGVSLVCIYCHLATDDPLFTLLILLLGLLAVFLYDLAWVYMNDSAVAADEPEEEVELEVPEADERSRWAVTCLIGCAGISLLRIACLVDHHNNPRMSLLMLLLFYLGVFLCGLFEAFVIQRYLNVEGQQKLVDKFLLFY
ncbi:uncharacterized protein [Triticum aestivum]|uniref:uncharacterized protein n=1 Tax=Triticum aestivum TaxID=4565 RepID=UPI001D01DC55|nr:uncharacterized protein LOC123115631 [Triticum aestivum]